MVLGNCRDGISDSYQFADRYLSNGVCGQVVTSVIGLSDSYRIFQSQGEECSGDTIVMDIRRPQGGWRCCCHAYAYAYALCVGREDREGDYAVARSIR